MQNGTISSFLKKVGDKVGPGDAVAEVQTDKATMAFEAQVRPSLICPLTHFE